MVSADDEVIRAQGNPVDTVCDRQDGASIVYAIKSACYLPNLRNPKLANRKDVPIQRLETHHGDPDTVSDFPNQKHLSLDLVHIVSLVI